jgi:hypothetical protein
MLTDIFVVFSNLQDKLWDGILKYILFLIHNNDIIHFYITCAFETLTFNKLRINQLGPVYTVGSVLQTWEF